MYGDVCPGKCWIAVLCRFWPHCSLKADSHIPCRAHAIPLPCRASKGLSFPFDSHSAALSDSHLSCHAPAMLRPCRSSQGHGTARPSRDGLCATYPRSASSGYHAEFHEGCSQKHTNLSPYSVSSPRHGASSGCG